MKTMLSTVDGSRKLNFDDFGQSEAHPLPSSFSEIKSLSEHAPAYLAQ